ncbi:MAG: TROVE domain-containing protein [Isosphaeraceae bacterium]
MANAQLFRNPTAGLPRADAFNEAGGRAYNLPPKQALAQIVTTGTLHNTFYANAASQLEDLLAIAAEEQVDDRFLGQLAVYSRERAYMKDMPAALLLILAKRNPAIFHQVFDRVVDNGRMLRTMLQMVRSGRFGRKGLSASLQRAFQRWLNRASVGKLLAASIGNNPSLRDVLRLARPTPADNARRALFGWLTGKDVGRWAPASADDLPPEVWSLVAYREAASEADQVAVLEKARFRWDLLADAAKGPAVWKAIARQMGHQALRMNLNTLLRHGVFEDPNMVEEVALRIADADEVRRSRQFPYQYLAASKNAEEGVPELVRMGLEDAAEAACGNVPALPTPALIGLDVSGSMQTPVTGHRGHGATSAVRCVDAAALFAAALLRRNPGSVVIPFDTEAYRADFSPNTKVVELANRLAAYGGGGTNCALPLQAAPMWHPDRKFGAAILVSDQESWVGQGRHGSTAVMTAWNAFADKQRKLGVADPKLVCIDLQPYATTQAPDRAEILNVGGFSDAVFHVVSSFLEGGPARLVAEIEAIDLGGG